MNQIQELNYSQRESVELQTKFLKAQTELAYELNKGGKRTWETYRQISKGSPLKSPLWITTWMVYLSVWIFILMVFKSNVYP